MGRNYLMGFHTEAFADFCALKVGPNTIRFMVTAASPLLLRVFESSLNKAYGLWRHGQVCSLEFALLMQEARGCVDSLLGEILDTQCLCVFLGRSLEQTE